jgi:hypothetical protein
MSESEISDKDRGENAGVARRCVSALRIDAAVQRTPKPMLGGHDDPPGSFNGVAEASNHWRRLCAQPAQFASVLDRTKF